MSEPLGERIEYDQTKGEIVSVPCAKCSVSTKHDVVLSVDYFWHTLYEDIQGDKLLQYVT